MKSSWWISITYKKNYFLKNQNYFNALKSQGFSISKYKSNKFAVAIFYILSPNQKNSKVYMYIKCELYLIESLIANMLIGNNIFCIKSFSINLANPSTHILKYRVNIKINTKSHF